MLFSQIKDVENCFRRSNPSIHSIPETIDDLTSFTTAILQELSPPIHIERLEFDRIHRALTRHLPDGPPHDIIISLHFYRMKEQFLLAAPSKDQLPFQGHTYQIFSDLAPLTVTKCRAMKPQLQILLKHQLKYT